MERGLQGGMGLGMSLNRCSSGSLFLLNGAANFFYTPQISGGVSVLFKGSSIGEDRVGVDDSEENTYIHNRYNVNVRRHFYKDTFAWFLGGAVAWDESIITDIQELKSGVSDALEKGSCAERSGLSLALESGSGYKMTRYWYFNSGASMQLNASLLYQMTVLGGISLDIMEIWPEYLKDLNGMYYFVEIGGIYDGDNFNFALLSGMSLSF